MRDDGRYTPKVVSRARELIDQGMKWSRVAARLGVTENGLRRRLDARFSDVRTQGRRSARGLVAPAGESRLRESEAEEIIATIPPDTRNMTARAFGDPLPGRSALDQEKRNSAHLRGEPQSSASQKKTRVAPSTSCWLIKDRHSSQAVN